MKKNKEFVVFVDRDAKELINKYGLNADLEFKEQIRMLDNLNEWNGWYLRDRLGLLIRKETDKKDKEKLMTVEEVAVELGVSEITIRNWIRGGVIVAERIGKEGRRGVIRFKREEVLRLKGQRK